MSRCKVKDSLFCPAGLHPHFVYRTFMPTNPFPWQRDGFHEQKGSQQVSMGLLRWTQAQRDRQASSKSPQLLQLYSIKKKKKLTRCLQVMPVPTDWPASHHPFWRPKPIPLMQNSISHDALCIHLVLKTCDTTVWVISSDPGMLKMKLRNFSIIFSLSIFWCS